MANVEAEAFRRRQGEDVPENVAVGVNVLRRETGTRVSWRTILNATVVISALGYFVDIYDLIVFSIVRVPSLRALGLPASQMIPVGVFLLNAQMAGMLLGGILWGVLGDKRGRVSVLFGSIALYSVCNIANAFVADTTQYAVLRFLSGVGLAGELGAAITLVSEVMSKETRGYGSAVVASVGIMGGVAAGLVGNAFDWRAAFIVGGVLGLVLLFARMRMADSGMYRNAAARSDVARGDLRMLLKPGRFGRYARVILVGVPVWFTIGILVTFAPEISKELGVTGPVLASTAVMMAYFGAALGDLVSCTVSQKIGTRKWVLLAYLAMTAAVVEAYAFLRGLSPESFYALCFLLGFGSGYWALFVTVASEQFGTNLRATVTTTVPNFVRGAVLPLTFGFQLLAPSLGLARAALAVGVVCLLVALASLRKLDETWGKDLAFVES